MNYLPDNILIQIFKFLDSESLAKVVRTCQRYKDVISSSSFLMRNIIFSIEEVEDAQKFNELPYRNIKIYQNDKKFICAIPLNEYLIETMKIICVDKFFNPHYLRQINSTLTHLTLEGFGLNSPNILDGNEIDLPKLTQLEIHNMCSTLRLIRAEKLRIFKISISWGLKVEEEDDINKFLAKCGQLKHLIYNYPIKFKVNEHTFQLESITILEEERSDYLISWKYEPFLEFITSQRKSLRILHFNFASPEDCVIKYLMSALNLKELRVSGFGLNKLNNLEINDTIKILRTDLSLNTKESLEISKIFIGNCSAVEQLTLSLYTLEKQSLGNFANFMNFISHKLINLKSLYLQEFTHTFIPTSLKFQNLQSLSLNLNSKTSNFMSFIMSCPHLQQLKIFTTLNEIQTDEVLEILDLKELEEIYFGAGFILTNEFVDTAISKAINLLRLKIEFRDVNCEKMFRKIARSKLHSTRIKCMILKKTLTL